MSAFLNALREEGTKEEILIQLERVMTERDAALKRADELQAAINEWVKAGGYIDLVEDEATEDRYELACARLAALSPKQSLTQPEQPDGAGL